MSERKAELPGEILGAAGNGVPPALRALIEHYQEPPKSACGHPGSGAGLREIRSDSHFPTKFSRPFLRNSHVLQLLGGFWDRIGERFAGQTTSTTKVKPVAFGKRARATCLDQIDLEAEHV